MMNLNSWLPWKPLQAIVVLATLLAGCGGQSGVESAFEIVNVTSPTAPGSMSPHLAVTPAGEAVMSWLEPAGDNAHAVRYSVLQGDSWSTPVSVAVDDGWFVNWADFPSVVPITAQQWAAHWLVKRPGGTYSYDIAVATSANGGTSWSTPVTPHTDNTPTEHGFVSMFPWSGGIGAVWLDGRQMAPDSSGESQPDSSGKYGSMTLRFARLDYDGAILDEGKVDNRVCECCMTDVAVAQAGPVVVYRDRTDAEIRDISVARYVDGGWTNPVTVSDDQWKIPGCPVNGPAIAAKDDHVVVAWYGAPKRKSRVKVAWSQDAGQTFSAPVVIDDASVSGRVDVTLLPGGAAMVSWIGKSADGVGQLRMRQVTPDGVTGPVQLIAEGEYSRNSGFPQMVKAGNRLVYAWPEPGKPKQVLTAFSLLGDG